VLASVLPQVRDIRRLGACSIDLCLVATGSLDAYYERGIHTWDMAAAMLVVTEAGGTVLGLDGAAPSEAMVVAAAGPLCGRVAGLVVEAGAGEDAQAGQGRSGRRGGRGKPGAPRPPTRSDGRPRSG